MLQGMLLVDKPADMTSHDVVALARRQLGVRRIGHTGTLDPAAQGLLILLIGAATKHQHRFQRHAKIYEATVRLGIQTDTGDAQGRPVREAAIPALAQDEVKRVLASLVGRGSQIPPAYSAVKVRGRPSYWWTRHNQPVALEARVVEIFELALLGLTTESLQIRVRCSAGTYVRRLAETIGERLGTVGHLTGLRRVQIGDWSLDGAVPVRWLREATVEAIAARLVALGEPEPVRRAHSSRP